MIDKKTITVTELTRHIKLSLESNFTNVSVRGEISNFKQHTSGHLYFTLKDETAQISAVMWRSRVGYLGFIPKDGMKVIARGSITVYPPRGNYQLDVVQIQQIGLGDLQQAFEQLKNKLSAEGLFDSQHKRPIPKFPNSIGIVTSETGAALQDILNILSRRQPSIEVVLAPVKVQGSGAAEEISEAIKQFNQFGGVDVIIVGRGGGSLEDLWAFNEEIVARAIYNSKIPIISAVGHEIDFSIADFVADLRAPTPSAAAELAVVDRVNILEDIGNLYYTIQSYVKNKLYDLGRQTESLISSYSFNRPHDLIREYSQRIDEFDRSIRLSAPHLVKVMRQKYESLNRQVESLNPDATLKRGYAIVRKEKKIINNAKSLNKDDSAEIQFHDGRIDVKVERG